MADLAPSKLSTLGGLKQIPFHSKLQSGCKLRPARTQLPSKQDETEGECQAQLSPASNCNQTLGHFHSCFNTSTSLVTWHHGRQAFGGQTYACTPALLQHPLMNVCSCQPLSLDALLAEHRLSPWCSYQCAFESPMVAFEHSLTQECFHHRAFDACQASPYPRAPRSCAIESAC